MRTVPIVRRQGSPVAWDIGCTVFWLVAAFVVAAFWLWIWRGLEGWL